MNTDTIMPGYFLESCMTRMTVTSDARKLNLLLDVKPVALEVASAAVYASAALSRTIVTRSRRAMVFSSTLNHNLVYNNSTSYLYTIRNNDI